MSCLSERKRRPSFRNTIAYRATVAGLESPVINGGEELAPRIPVQFLPGILSLITPETA